MAQKRMIDKKISVSEQVANLGEKGALLFTWMIPHADDVGLLPFSSRTIKALVVPMFDYTVEDVDFQLDTMRKSNLISIFQYKDKKYWKLTSFIKEQSGLKRDRQPQTILDCKLNEDPKDSWKTLYSILEDIAPVLVPELKRREVKRNYPKDKEENTKEKPIIPSGSLPKGFEILKEFT